MSMRSGTESRWPKTWTTGLVIALIVAACDGTSVETTGADTDGSTTHVGDTSSTTQAPVDGDVPVVTLHHDAGVGPLFEPYVADFNERYDDIELASDFVPQDYFGVTNTQLAAGDVEFDVFFGNPSDTQGWWDAGFLLPLDDMAGVEEILAEVEPGTEELLRAEDGSLMALPYFVGLEVFAYNQAHLDAIGASAPTTWEEFVDVARELKAEGVVDTPYSPFWSQDFDIIWWAFAAEVFSDGGDIFGPDGEPLFVDDPVVRSTLERWVLLYEEDLVPADIFTTPYGDVVNIYGGGRSSFTIRYQQSLIGYTDPEQSQVVEDIRIGLIPGSTRDSYRWLATWNVSAETDEPEASWEVLRYFAYKDRDGEFYAPINLIGKDFGLMTPYSEVNESPEMREIISAWADPDVLAQQTAMSRTVSVEKEAWFAEFRTLFAGILQDIIRGNTSIDDGLAQAAEFVEANR